MFQVKTEATSSGLFTAAQDATCPRALNPAYGFRSQKKNDRVHKHSGAVRNPELLPGRAVNWKVTQGQNMISRLTKSPHWQSRTWELASESISALVPCLWELFGYPRELAATFNCWSEPQVGHCQGEVVRGILLYSLRTQCLSQKHFSLHVTSVREPLNLKEATECEVQ